MKTRLESVVAKVPQFKIEWWNIAKAARKEITRAKAVPQDQQMGNPPMKAASAASIKRDGRAQEQFAISLLMSVALTCGSSAYAGASWDLAGDWNPPANPNGAWTYGDYDSNALVNLTYMSNDVGGAGAYLPVGGGATDGFIYKNLTGGLAYGIYPGQVSLESDWGTAVARWTAPTSGFYDISVLIGGTTVTEGGGYGNNFAQDAGLNINMVGQTADSFDNNVKSWTFANILLSAGTTVDAYVAYPGFANGGNTQTSFHVDAVAQPPLLTITYSANQAIVSWPPSVTGWTLQTNNDLTTTNWGNYLGTIVNNTVTNSPPMGSLFFRLTQP